MQTTPSPFYDLESDFYHYMILYGRIAPKTCHDYVTRMRFLAKYYILDSNFSEERIQEIMDQEKKTYTQRDKYCTPKALSDLHAGLRKFLAFVQSDYHKRIEESVMSEIINVKEDIRLTTTEREQIVKSRVGQGIFRASLINYWQGCSVSGCLFIPALVASHIKPWSACDNVQRIDKYNGLLLQPNLDKLFDRGYITFDSKGKLQCSRLLEANDRTALGIKRDMHLLKIEDSHKQYLSYHQEFCFIG